VLAADYVHRWAQLVFLALQVNVHVLFHTGGQRGGGRHGRQRLFDDLIQLRVLLCISLIRHERQRLCDELNPAPRASCIQAVSLALLFEPWASLHGINRTCPATMQVVSRLLTVLHNVVALFTCLGLYCTAAVLYFCCVVLLLQGGPYCPSGAGGLGGLFITQYDVELVIAIESHIGHKLEEYEMD